MFRAIPIQEAIVMLVERKKQKNQVLLAEAKELFNLFACAEEAIISQESKRFILIPKKEACVSRVKKAVEVARESMLMTTP